MNPSEFRKALNESGPTSSAHALDYVRHVGHLRAVGHAAADAWEAERKDSDALRERLGALKVEMHNLLARWEIVRLGDEIDVANFCIDVMDGLAALAYQPLKELGFLDQPPVSAIFDDTITERLSKTRQMLEKKLASQPEVTS
jgi:hypothetical protein